MKYSEPLVPSVFFFFFAHLNLNAKYPQQDWKTSGLIEHSYSGLYCCRDLWGTRLIFTAHCICVLLSKWLYKRLIKFLINTSVKPWAPECPTALELQPSIPPDSPESWRQKLRHLSPFSFCKWSGQLFSQGGCRIAALAACREVIPLSLIGHSALLPGRPV